MAKIGLLAFQPIFQYRIWGGEKLRTVLGKKYYGNNIGESWEVSAVKNNETAVASGAFQGKTLPYLIHLFKEELVGEKSYKIYGNDFPILIKFIDAATPLSVQVHPDDDLAQKRHNSLGKNEMWYIMDTDEKADLLIGFKKKINKETFAKHIKQGNVMSVFNRFPVQKEALYFLPAGRIHAIGKGVLLAEIQQTSDVTYRIYDYDRVEVKTGQKRELHIEKALDAIDFQPVKQYQTPYPKQKNKINLMIDTPYFKTEYLIADKVLPIDYPLNQSFKIFICTQGKGLLKSTVNTLPIQKGQTLFLPANESQLEIIPLGNQSIKLLQVRY